MYFHIYEQCLNTTVTERTNAPSRHHFSALMITTTSNHCNSLNNMELQLSLNFGIEIII